MVAGAGRGRQLLIAPATADGLDAVRSGTLEIPSSKRRSPGRTGELLASFRSQRLGLTTADGEVDVFVEVHPPRPKLVIVGAVHVAAALVSFANTLGFKTIVVDPRTAFATAERFAHADQLRTDWPDEALRAVGINENTYLALLSHDLKLDVPALEVALPSPARYIGALGSKKTHGKRLAALEEKGLADVRRSADPQPDRPRSRRPPGRGDRGVDHRRDDRGQPRQGLPARPGMSPARARRIAGVVLAAGPSSRFGDSGRSSSPTGSARPWCTAPPASPVARLDPVWWSWDIAPTRSAASTIWTSTRRVVNNGCGEGQSTSVARAVEALEADRRRRALLPCDQPGLDEPKCSTRWSSAWGQAATEPSVAGARPATIGSQGGGAAARERRSIFASTLFPQPALADRRRGRTAGPPQSWVKPRSRSSTMPDRPRAGDDIDTLDDLHRMRAEPRVQTR